MHRGSVGWELNILLIQVPTILTSKPLVLNLRSESEEERLSGALPLTWDITRSGVDGQGL